MKKGYVSQDKAPWLRYALEKRVITLITLVPLIILGLLIAPPCNLYWFFYCILLATNLHKWLPCEVCWKMFSLFHAGRVFLPEDFPLGVEQHYFGYQFVCGNYPDLAFGTVQQH